MISRVIDLSVAHRPLVLLLTAILVVLSFAALGDLHIDALPDLSDVQVIVISDYPGQSDEAVDQEVTLPLAATLLATPGATDVRGLSMFGVSFEYVMFEEGTDLHSARSRVLEQLSVARQRLPHGVEPRLGPDATGVGWVFQYALRTAYYCGSFPRGVWHDPSNDQWYRNREAAPPHRRPELVRRRGFTEPGRCPVDATPLVHANLDLSELRRLQDWYLRFPLAALEGVAEVAPFGGFVREFQVTLDPIAMQARRLSLPAVTAAIERSNRDVGAGVVERGEQEWMVRSRGRLRTLEDIGNIAIGLTSGNTPIPLREIATLQMGGETRRGVGELDGEGETVGAIVVARSGENAYRLIDKIKARLTELEDGLPAGVLIVPTYDRSALIGRALDTLRSALLQELAIVALMCVVFLAHLRSALVAVITLPIGLLIALLAMQWVGINADIMSLGGLALAIGVMVDAAVVMVENAHKHLEREQERVAAGASPRDRTSIILAAAREVGPSLFVAAMVIIVSFLPIFALGEQSGRLFRPLAYTKTFAIAAGALLGITLVPVLMVTFIRGRLRSELRNPANRISISLYAPLFRIALRRPRLTLAAATLVGLSAFYPAARIGEEFMPALDEGDLLYMPTTASSIGLTKGKELLQQTDKLIRSFPEVVSVHGKLGRAETATDPAPLSMIETVVQLQPDRSQWRQREITRWFDGAPDWLCWPLTASFWPSRRPLTVEELTFGWNDASDQHHAGIHDVLDLPGLTNAWPFPIEGRIEMLSTGIKTPVGIKIIGPDLEMLDRLAEHTALVLRSVEGTRSAYAEQALSSYHLDIDIDRDRAMRYGLTTGDIQDVVQTAIGGKTVTTIVDGLERYPLTVRYPRDLRSDPEALADVLIASPTGGFVALAELGTTSVRPAATMIRSENAQPTAWVLADIEGRDLGGYVTAARAAVEAEVKLPEGYRRLWSGRYQHLADTNQRLRSVLPITVALILLLLYLANRSWQRVAMILTVVPFSLAGAFWLLWCLDYNLSVAVWIGIIALLGLDAETGQVMLLYLDESFSRFHAAGRMRDRNDLYDAVYDGAVRRIRPKTMTVASDIVGLLPLLWVTGTGAEVTRRIVAPMIGGLGVGFLTELLIYPVIFYQLKSRHLPDARLPTTSAPTS